MKPAQSLMRIQLLTVIRSLGNDLSTQETKLLQLLECFYQKMHDDLMIGYFFTGKDLKHIAHQQAKFLLNAAGLIDSFQGKGPHSAHTELPPIWEGHFDRRLVLLRETLKEQGIPLPIIELWVSFENAFREMVVSK